MEYFETCLSNYNQLILIKLSFLLQFGTITTASATTSKMGKNKTLTSSTFKALYHLTISPSITNIFPAAVLSLSYPSLPSSSLHLLVVRGNMLPSGPGTCSISCFARKQGGERQERRRRRTRTKGRTERHWAWGGNPHREKETETVGERRGLNEGLVRTHLASISPTERVMVRERRQRGFYFWHFWGYGVIDLFFLLHPLWFFPTSAQFIHISGLWNQLLLVGCLCRRRSRKEI